MNRNPIVVGVDGTPESARAASVAAKLAHRMGSTYTLVSAVADIAEAAYERARIRASLAGCLPGGDYAPVELATGAPGLALAAAAERLDASLIVVGSRRYHGLARFRARIGSYLCAEGGPPVLVVNDSAAAVERVLVALDLTPGSQHTFAVARDWVRMFGAQLRVLHVVEPRPRPVLPGMPNVFMGPDEPEEVVVHEAALWAGIDTAEAEKVLRVGFPAACIADEAAAWKADLVVVGAKAGGGWVDQLAVGGTVARLLHKLPALTLVVPAARRARSCELNVGALPWEERAAETV